MARLGLTGCIYIKPRRLLYRRMYKSDPKVDRCYTCGETTKVATLLCQQTLFFDKLCIKCVREYYETVD